MMRFLPTQSNANLPKLEEEDWDSLHYAMVLQSSEGILLIGIGDTITECKNNTISHLIKTKMSYNKLQKVMKYFALVNLNDGISYEVKRDNFQKINIYYCEAKVYIYAQRYGIKGMKLIFENNSNCPMVRYAGYDEEMTAMSFNNQF